MPFKNILANILEVFNDETTKSLEIVNFQPKVHSCLLEIILKRCSQLKTLILNFSSEKNKSIY